MEEIKIQVALMKQRQETHEQYHDEFMARTDRRLESMVHSMTAMQRQLAEWATIRKTLLWVASALVTAGGIAGWLINHFWPKL